MSPRSEVLPENIARREGAVLQAVTEGYLEIGKMLNVPAIAARLGWSESKVRNVLTLCAGGVPKGLIAHRDGNGYLYAPALWHLREMLLEERQAPRCPTCRVKRAVAGYDGYCASCWNDKALSAAGAV